MPDATSEVTSVFVPTATPKDRVISMTAIYTMSNAVTVSFIGSSAIEIKREINV